MTAAVSPAESKRLTFAPGLRLARILWRILPMIGWVATVVIAGFVFDVGTVAMGQITLMAVVALVYAVIAALIREILSPDRPWLRLLPINDIRAHRLDMALRTVLFILTVCTAGIYLVRANGWSAGVADILRVVRNVVFVLSTAVVLGTTGVFHWLRRREGEGLPSTLARFVANVVFPLAVLTMTFVAAARGLGYYPMAAWVIHASAWTTLKLLGAVLVYRWLRRTLYRTVRFYTAEEGVVGMEAGAVLEPNPYALGTVRVATGLTKIALVVLTFLWILRDWSLSVQGLREAFSTTIVVGESLTWGHLIHGGLRVAATLALGWLLRSVLTYFIFPGSKTGVGARYAILAVLRYTVVGLAIVFALGALGFNTGSLSWFFGAAGIGLAFGLQDIIGNFVGGLIMLIERPIRVGDTVNVGTTMGKVEDIRMRGTVIRTFDNTSVLIPNSQMLGERVTNMTHGMAHSRIKVPLMVPHDADPRVVESILLAAAARNDGILKEPAPFVWFSEFSPSSLDFTLICYTSNLGGRFGIASAIRFDIVERLRAAGIEIPYPQQDVHIRSGPSLPAGQD